MTTNQVLWLESFSEEEETVKQKINSERKFEFYEEPFQDVRDENLAHEMIVTTRTHSKIPDRYHDSIQCLITRSTGYDHLINTGLMDSNFPIAYLPDYATKAVAEHNLMVALALIRKLHSSQDAVKKFNRDNLTGHEITSLTVGVVGVGRIGRKTVELISSLGVDEIIGFDKSEETGWSSNPGFSYETLQTLFNECNLIFLCLPLNEETNQIISKDLLEQTPEPAYLINTGRGEVVKSRDLLDSLNEGTLDGVGLDVFNRESEVAEILRTKDNVANVPEEIRAGTDLINHPRVVATPHNAFNTHSALERKVSRTLDNIKTYQDTGTVIDSVREQVQ